LDVYIDGVGGYDHVLPPPIPEPYTALLMLQGLAVVGACTLQRRRDSP
jgi:hypothetical protein